MMRRCGGRSVLQWLAKLQGLTASGKVLFVKSSVLFLIF